MLEMASANALSAEAALYSVDWWLIGKDLPDLSNRVHLKGDKISLKYTDNGIELFPQLVDRWIESGDVLTDYLAI
jgi:hypothetical protein